MAEVDRLEIDVSAQAAERTRYSLTNFLQWLGRDLSLEQITTPLIEAYQRHRLRKAAVNTVTRELDSIIRMLRQNGFTVRKPGYKPGRKTEDDSGTSSPTMRVETFSCGLRGRGDTHKAFFIAVRSAPGRVAEVLPSPIPTMWRC